MGLNYNLTGSKWSGPTITWSTDATIDTSWLGEIANAFAEWAKYTNLSFVKVASSGNITFTERVIDGVGGTLGQAGWWGVNGRTTAARIDIDSSEDYHSVGGEVFSTLVGKISGSFEKLVLHEIGHALGLGHIDASVELATMNPYLNGNLVSGLTQSDITGIQALYGVRAGAPAATNYSGLDQADAAFRFFDTKTGDHFYTTSAAEKASIMATIPNYKYEGVGWGVPHKNADTIDVFRFFDTKTGTHFLTTSAAERDNINQTLANYKYEGVAFQAYAKSGQADSITLDRFFNTTTGLHHFAANAGETAGILAGKAGTDWVFEGPAITVAAYSGDLLNL